MADATLNRRQFLERAIAALAFYEALPPAQQAAVVDRVRQAAHCPRYMRIRALPWDPARDPIEPGGLMRVRYEYSNDGVTWWE